MTRVSTKPLIQRLREFMQPHNTLPPARRNQLLRLAIESLGITGGAVNDIAVKV